MRTARRISALFDVNSQTSTIVISHAQGPNLLGNAGTTAGKVNNRQRQADKHRAWSMWASESKRVPFVYG